MPEYVLRRVYAVMKEKGMTDVGRVGLYGMTFKENVDDYRDSPTLQLLQCQREHLGQPLKVYDPYIEKDLAERQYHDLDAFLNDVDLVVVMVKHDQIRQEQEKLAGKTVVDCCNVIRLPGVYRL